MKFLLKYIKTQDLWDEIIRRESFELVEEIEAKQVWTEVFHRVPLAKEWLRQREIILLKGMFLGDKVQDFIKGQIAENKLYQSFDVPSLGNERVEQTKQEEKTISKEHFLARWKQNNANNK